jgi:hypothetical protein
VPAFYILLAADHHAEKASVTDPDAGAQGEPTPA